MSNLDQGEFTLRVGDGIGAFTPEEWSQLSGTSSGAPGYNPFLSHAFLSALEDSGCVDRKSGWLPQFLRLEDVTGTVIGAVPCYLKGHSQGEYVFDHGWADAFERAGGRYYPKLQASIPFTPATGPRLLVHRDWDGPAVRAALANGLRQLTGQLGVSSAHSTFVNTDDLPAFNEAGFLHRIDQQFHFFNEGYATYDDFLDSLAARKRKALKRERREALADGISIDRLTGNALTKPVWDDFFTFYTDTGNRKWGRPYLNREFYRLIGERMPGDIVLMMARRGGRYIAGAINFIGSDRLFGRHWGCIEDHRFLHFEVCYHQAIDFAIERKLHVVEAGAQGEHKLARGYLPVTTHSAHYIAHEGLRRAVAGFLEHERNDVAMMSDVLNEHAPFKKSDC
ncbi:GNAT family N-acetyltransferase [Phyllobacterium sp. NPDC097923]